jgi:hypothetical protein
MDHFKVIEWCGEAWLVVTEPHLVPIKRLNRSYIFWRLGLTSALNQRIITSNRKGT